MMENQTQNFELPAKPQGFAKLLGWVVGGVLVAFGLFILGHTFVADDNSSPPSVVHPQQQQVQPQSATPGGKQFNF